MDTWVIESWGSAAIATMNDQQLDCVLDLMRYLPPQQIDIDLIDLVPSLSEDLSSVDQTLKIVQEGGGKGLPFCVTTTEMRTPIGHHL